ncbi:TRAP transporter large permease [Marinobacterium sedimentorum]|uniref:TRAP transporter large permease n=1 Tax=Marinobacterium sedimentorum TaxID=2927804 RepID=UPI0020C5D32F|nr:TRAP transporter large permease [Marinobacterium sedimentorum]MCP8689781.1 TRAP transporter large permease [Marinobacterium sedimentorum]
MIEADFFWLLPWALFLLLGLFITIGIPIAFALIASAVAITVLDPRLTNWIVFQRMYNGMDSFVLLAVPIFLLAGNLINQAEVTDKLIRFAMNLLGRFKGALAHVNVAVSMMFAGVSGSSTADSAGVGSILIPSMKREGYPTEFAVAVTAASSVIGIIIPPSINMIVWGALTNTSIGGMFLAGIVPGIMIGLSQLLTNTWFVRKLKIPVQAPASRRALLISSKDGLLAAAIPVLIIGGIRFGWFTPTEAAVIAVIYALFLGFVIYRTLNLSKVMQASTSTIRLSALSLFSLVAASIFGYLISFYEVPNTLMGGITLTDPVTLMLVMTLVMLLIGTFMDSLPAMAIIAPLFLPLALQAGIHPVQFGIVGVMALGFGLITPPYGLCLMIASKIGGINLLKCLVPTLIYLGAMTAVLLLIIVFPELTLGLPELMAPELIGIRS